MSQITVADVLREGRKVYDASPSHAAVGMFPARGTFCAITALEEGAVRAGTGRASRARTDAVDGAARALKRAIKRLDRKFDGGIARWNADHTTAEVLAAFDLALKKTEVAS